MDEDVKSIDQELDKWWSSLKVSEKERIATKLTGNTTQYPECTDVWKTLGTQTKYWVREHCTNKHGIVFPAWQDGKSFSY